MLEPTYRQALSRAWALVWHHKIVWVLGLLSVFVGELGLSNFIGQLWGKLVSSEDGWWPENWRTIHIATQADFFWLGWVVIIVAAILLFIVVAAICAQAALIYIAQHWYRYHTIPKISVAWHKASKHFWGVLAINVVEKFLLSVLLAVVVAILPYLGYSVGAVYTTILVVAVAVFAALLIVLTSIYALGYIVHDSVPAVEAVGAGWRLLKKHLLVSLELTAILLVCNVIIAFIVIAGSLIVLAPSVIVMLVGNASASLPIVSFAVGMYLLLFVMFIVTLGAFFNAFVTAAWMYLFMKMHHEGLTSRLIRLTRWITKRT